MEITKLITNNSINITKERIAELDTVVKAKKIFEEISNQRPIFSITQSSISPVIPKDCEYKVFLMTDILSKSNEITRMDIPTKSLARDIMNKYGEDKTGIIEKDLSNYMKKEITITKSKYDEYFSINVPHLTNPQDVKPGTTVSIEAKVFSSELDSICSRLSKHRSLCKEKFGIVDVSTKVGFITGPEEDGCLGLVYEMFNNNDKRVPMISTRFMSDILDDIAADIVKLGIVQNNDSDISRFKIKELKVTPVKLTSCLKFTFNVEF